MQQKLLTLGYVKSLELDINIPQDVLSIISKMYLWEYIHVITTSKHYRVDLSKVLKSSFDDTNHE